MTMQGMNFVAFSVTSDPLATLASAAINSASVSTSNDIKQEGVETKSVSDPVWFPLTSSFWVPKTNFD